MFIAYQDIDNLKYGTGIVATISGTTISSYGTPVVFESAETAVISATVLDGTHVFIAYHDGGNSKYGTAIVATISSGDVISYGTAVVFESAETDQISATALDSTHAFIGYQDVGNSKYGTGIVAEIICVSADSKTTAVP